VQGRVQGGGSLDEVGRAQAVALAERLSTQPFDAIYASPALRARQTARAVARSHHLQVRQRGLLRDLDYGKYAGALLKDVDPVLVQRWRDHPDTVQFEGGERLADLRGRIHRFIEEAAADHPRGTVLAATHDSPVRVAASLALGIDDSQHNWESLITPLASVTVLEVDGQSLRLETHKDASHLVGVGDGS
jgi:broad specificity phosphatase PhoE